MLDGIEAPAPDYTAEAAKGLRQARDVRAVGRQTVAPGGRSWWEQKTREELNAEATARAEAMGKTAVGRSVRGQVNTP